MTMKKHKWRCEQDIIQSLSSHRRGEENEEFLDIEIVFAEFHLNIIINNARDKSRSSLIWKVREEIFTTSKVTAGIFIKFSLFYFNCFPLFIHFYLATQFIKSVIHKCMKCQQDLSRNCEGWFFPFTYISHLDIFLT